MRITNSHLWMKVALTTVLATVMTSLAWGQNSGTVSGVVQDGSGAVIPGAAITIRNTATGVATETQSLADGKYQLPNVMPGPYEMGAEKEGFKRYISSQFEVHVSDRLTLNIALQLGETRETVTVTAEAAPLRTEDAQTGEVINNNFIRNMPQLNRNPFALLGLSGGVAGNTTTNASGQNSVQINGGRTSSVDYYVDGAVVNSGQSNALTGQTPSMDAVAEFKVVTSGISAEFGRISGGYITLVTKSGTNTYHGSAYEYMFNDLFNAQAWDQNAIGAPKTHFRQNNYGFTFGGPVSIPKVYDGKNRTFFFVDNEYLKKTQAGKVTLNSIPNADEMAGDLSKTIYQNKVYLAYDQYGRQEYSTKDNAWAKLDLLGGDGRHVPASRISPVAVAIMKYLPKANRPSVAGYSSFNNYGFGSGSSLYNFRFGTRLDHNFSPNHRVQLSYRTFDTNAAATPTMENQLYTSTVTESNGGLSGSLNYTWLINPTLIADFRASSTHNPLLSGATHDPALNNSFLPSPYQYYLGNNEIQTIAVSFMSGTPYAQNGNVAIANSSTYNFGGTVTKIMAKHTLKFGGEHRRYYDNFTNAGTANTTNFMVDPTYRLAGEWGNGFIDGRVLGLSTYLLGINNRNNVARPTTRSMGTPYLGAFIQDDWKINSKFTINLGLRWDNERATTERNNNLFFWDANHAPMFTTNPGYVWADAVKAAGLPASTPAPSWAQSGKFENGAMMIAGSSEFPGRSPQSVKNLLFSPRIGFAYQVDSKTVVRAYGGKMWLPTTGNPSAYSTTNNSVALSDQAIAGWHSSDDGYKTFNSTWTNPFPHPESMISKFTRDIKTVNLQSSGDPGSTALASGMSMPREYDWSVNMQRQLPMKLIVELGYNGNRGLGLLATEIISHYPSELFKPEYAQMMQVFVDSPNAGQTLEGIITGRKQMLGLLQYKYPYYGRVAITGSNQGMSTYHGMTTRVERRFAQGLSVLFNYTRSRLQDDVGGSDGQGGKAIQSIDNFHKAWGLSPLDRKHRVNLAYTYELPFGKGRHWMGSPSNLASKILDYGVGGWTIAGNWSYMTGQPMSLSANNSNNINNNIKVTTTWPSYATSDHNILSPGFTDFRNILYSPVDPVVPNKGERYFDSSKVFPARIFVSGDMPPNDDRYRDPSFRQMDLSLMKNFAVGEGRYFQIRGEAQNAFNFRGFGPVNSQIGNATYGLITTAGNTPRQIQFSARFNF